MRGPSSFTMHDELLWTGNFVNCLSLFYITEPNHSVGDHEKNL